MHGDSFENLAAVLIVSFRMHGHCEFFISIVVPFDVVISLMIQRPPSLRQNPHGMSESFNFTLWRMCGLMWDTSAGPVSMIAQLYDFDKHSMYQGQPHPE